MVTEPFVLGAYWGPRRESVDACAMRLSRCLRELGSAHEVLASWYRKGTGRAARQKPPVATDVESLRDLLLAGRNRTDFGREVIEELGFSVDLWNRNPVEVGLGIHCGSHTTVAGIMNSFVLDLPKPDASSAPLFSRDVAGGLVRTAAWCWEPDWAVLTTSSLRERQAAGPREPSVGWVTYLRDPRPIPNTLPTGVIAERLNGGTLLLVGGSAEDVPVDTVDSLRDDLTRAGTLYPTLQTPIAPNDP